MHPSQLTHQGWTIARYDEQKPVLATSKERTRRSAEYPYRLVALLFLPIQAVELTNFRSAEALAPGLGSAVWLVAMSQQQAIPGPFSRRLEAQLRLCEMSYSRLALAPEASAGYKSACGCLTHQDTVGILVMRSPLDRPRRQRLRDLHTLLPTLGPRKVELESVGSSQLSSPFSVSGLLSPSIHRAPVAALGFGVYLEPTSGFEPLTC